MGSTLAGTGHRQPARRHRRWRTAGGHRLAALVSSMRFIEFDAAASSNNTVRVMARNISPATFHLGSATLSVQVTKRQVP